MGVLPNAAEPGQPTQAPYGLPHLALPAIAIATTHRLAEARLPFDPALLEHPPGPAIVQSNQLIVGPPQLRAPVRIRHGEIYGTFCIACHASGVNGAPKTGNADDWAPRIAQGKETLVKHALEGFNRRANFRY